MAGQNIARWKTKINSGRKKLELGRYHVVYEIGRCENITGKPQLRGNTQMNRNGLIYDLRTC